MKFVTKRSRSRSCLAAPEIAFIESTTHMLSDKPRSRSIDADLEPAINQQDRSLALPRSGFLEPSFEVLGQSKTPTVVATDASFAVCFLLAVASAACTNKIAFGASVKKTAAT